MNLPEKQLLRRGEVRAYLGVDEHVMKQIIGAGTLTPVYLTGKKGRAFFKRVDVVKLTSASALPGGSQTITNPPMPKAAADKRSAGVKSYGGQEGAKG